VKERGQKMIKIIGMKTGKTYAEGSHKADCFRKLQKDYQYPKREIDNLYPEPLLILKGGEAR
jgi:hypothetical protein